MPPEKNPTQDQNLNTTNMFPVVSFGAGVFRKCELKSFRFNFPNLPFSLHLMIGLPCVPNAREGGCLDCLSMLATAVGILENAAVAPAVLMALWLALRLQKPTGVMWPFKTLRFEHPAWAIEDKTVPKPGVTCHELTESAVRVPDQLFFTHGTSRSVNKASLPQLMVVYVCLFLVNHQLLLPAFYWTRGFTAIFLWLITKPYMLFVYSS